MPKKFEYPQVKAFIEERGYILVNQDYTNQLGPLHTICPKGHDYHTDFKKFRNGYKCPVCIGNKKKTIEEVRDFFNKEGYRLLSKEYGNSVTKLHTICPKGHHHHITYSDFKQGYRCSECAGKRKRTVEEVRFYLKKEGYELVSTKYVNCTTKIHTICPKGHPYSVIFSAFQVGNRCLECSGKRKRTIEEVRAIFEKENYRLVSTEYVNSEGLLDFICPRGHEHKICISSFLNGHRCGMCCPGQTSKPELELFYILKEHFPGLIKRSFPIEIPGKQHIHRFQVDIFDTKTKCGVEYDGPYHHSEKFLIKSKTKIGWPVEDAINYHTIKDSSLWDCHGVKIIHIKDKDWKADKEACVQRCLTFLKTGECT